MKTLPLPSCGGGNNMAEKNELTLSYRAVTNDVSQKFKHQ